MATTMSRQEIERLFQQMGLGQRGYVQDYSPTNLNEYAKDYRPSLVPEPEALPPKAGIMKEFGRGIISPITLATDKLGLTEEAPTPTSMGGSLARIAGSVVGWVGAGMIVGATGGSAAAGLAFGAKAAAAVKAGTMVPATAIALTKTVATGAILGGYRGWAVTEVAEAEDIIKEAAKGAAYAAVFFGAAKGISHVWNNTPMGENLRTGMRDTITKVRYGKNALPYSPDQVQAFTQGVDDVAAVQFAGQLKERARDAGIPLPKRVWDTEAADTLLEGGRVSKAQLATAIKNFDTLPDKEQLRYVSEVLRGNPAHDYVFKPVFQSISSMTRASKLTGVIQRGQTGLPKHLENTKNLQILGTHEPIQNLPGVEPTHTTLLGQVKSINQKMVGEASTIRKLLADNGVMTGKDLQGKALTDWMQAHERLANLDATRMQMLPTINKVLNLADQGQIGTRVLKELDDELKAIHESGTTQIKVPHKIFRDYVAQHGNGRSLDELMQDPAHRDILVGMQWRLHASRDPATMGQISETLGRKIGPDELIWEMTRSNSPLGKLTQADVQAMIKALPEYKPLTSLDDMALAKDINILARLEPKRKVLGETVVRTIRTAAIKKENMDDAYLKQASKILGEKLGPTARLNKETMHYREQVAMLLQDPKRLENSTPEMQAVVEKFRRLFQTAGRELGIADDILMDKNYIPKLAKVFTGEINYKNAPKEVQWFADYQSHNGVAFVNRQLDIWELFSAYVKGGTRQRFYDPVIKAIDKGFAKVSPTTGERYVSGLKAQYWNDVKTTLLGTPSATEKAIDNTIGSMMKTLFNLDKSGSYTREITSWMNELTYTGTLGYNPFSAIKNLTQQISAVTQLDKNPLVGIEYWYKAKKAMATDTGKQMLEWNYVLTGREAREGLNNELWALKNLPGIGKLQQHSFDMFKWADRNNVNTSYMMKLLHGLDKKLALSDAVEEAYTFTMATQYMYGKDSPLLFSGPLGKQLGILMSWPINFASMLASSSPTQAASTLAAYAFGAETLSLSGLSFRSIHPVELARGLLPVSMLEGEKSWPIPLRLLNATYTAAKIPFQDDPEEQEQAWDNFKRTAVVLAPFSTVGKRVVNFVDEMQNEWKKYDARGRLKYESNPRDALISLIGPTTAAKNRWETLEQISLNENAYRRQRRIVVDAFIDGDYEKFQNEMTMLLAVFGQQVDVQDIEQEIKLRQVTAIDRRLTSLPETMRTGF